MTPTYSSTGSRRRVFVPVPAGPVPPAPQIPDPPIYRELMRTWADGGRTLPGRHDPEWVRLAEPPRGLGDFFATGDFFTTGDLRVGSGFAVAADLTAPRDPRGDGR
ncbi:MULTISPECIES: hypothetical protein [Streptomyces]|uniref:Uncharacterized protein n=1 Tax=Streptomyces tendae TaxID=1932 RepID=A0A6B3QZQ1_STRTE|nr:MULTISPECIES: hypothetical protein [Streptomyces]MBQ0964711.1 hypothetical protein [Streptomyces sp. RK74B]MBQ1003890.1 hypothetical protein [Streptomyces sp. RK23]MCW1092856.1 hypothetical protein [Streptomyces sp. RS2]MZG12953.1 hypothetical protein [Streptomyces sp. SID5914]NEV91384.1 hypothetical protein [Streptomyces tendae]